MGCRSQNATAPSPPHAPGAEVIDVRRAAEAIAGSHGGAGMDPRLPALVPGFDAPMFQAGLAGYSEAPMRLIARRHGCPLCVTEALLDRTLLGGGRGFAKADLGELEENVPGGADDHPLVGQIMGSDPREMAAAAVKMVEQGARHDRAYRALAAGDGGGPIQGEAASRTFAAIDVNLACPVKKVDRRARGGHWMREPAGAIRILEAVREALPPEIPVTVKIRRSYDDTAESAASSDRILRAAFDIGIAWATVHGRTVEQKYVGPSRWDVLRAVVRAHPGRLILGSGDVWSAEDVVRMIAYTGVSAVSVARGCIGNPWIFRQVRDLLAGREVSAPTIEEQRGVLREHFALVLRCAARGGAESQRVRDVASRSMRKFGVRFARHHPRAEEVRLAMIGVSRPEDWERVLEEFYAEEAVLTPAR